MNTGLFTGALACALLLPATVHAQQQKSRPLIGGHHVSVAAFISQYDDNADGRLPWAEFEAFRRNRFDATDSNHNGTVDHDEYVQEFQTRRHAALTRKRNTLLEQAQTRFDNIDQNHDHGIAREEFDASGKRVLAAGQKTLAALEDGSDKALRARNNFALVPNSHTAEGFLALYDSNKDGEVDNLEFADHRNQQFNRTDSNKDGRIDRNEYLEEFAARVDARMTAILKAPDPQSTIRFHALDSDDNGAMTFAEYQVSGKRLFAAEDHDQNGVVDATDDQLAPVAGAAPAMTGNADK